MSCWSFSCRTIILYQQGENKIGKSKRYLSRDLTNGVYDDKWKLVVPKQLSIKNGVMEDAAI